MGVGKRQTKINQDEPRGKEILTPRKRIIVARGNEVHGIIISSYSQDDDSKKIIKKRCVS